MEKIKFFRGNYRFLSNFYGAPVIYKGVKFLNAESAFQSQKEPARMKAFSELPPNEAKSLGRRVNLRTDWDDVKVNIMREIVTEKFTQNKYLRNKLIETGNKELIEGNYWNDTFWGVCKGKGENNLGEILMGVREKLITGEL